MLALSTLLKLEKSLVCSFYTVMSLSAGYGDRNEILGLLRRLFSLEYLLGSFVLSH